MEIIESGAASPVPPVARIEDYGLIGDTRTAALCSYSGCIDWLCLPIFDSDPVFGRLVGGESWGTFALSPVHPRSTTRRYVQESAELETEWVTDTGRLRLTEGMVFDVRGALRPQTLLVRRLEAPDAPVEIVIRFDPRFKGRRPHVRRWGDGLVCSWGSLAIGLDNDAQLSLEPGVDLRVVIPPGVATFAMSSADHHPLIGSEPRDASNALQETRKQWNRWSSQIDYRGPRRDAILRSLLTLRLLTFSPSGAPVAAPTTSLPESLDGDANWDYRFAWPRDASIGVETFLGAGRYEEAESFLRWLRHATRTSHPRIAPLYTVYGRPPAAERELVDATGYEGALPVRVGNLASTQHQLDVYGWVMDAAWQLTGAGRHIDASAWRTWSAFADFAADHWGEKDAGIWEERGRTRHHVHSKLMLWRTLDRAIRIADARARGRRLPQRAAKRHERWARERERVATDVLEQGYDPQRNTFTRDYESAELDAAVLTVLPDFEPAGSPRLSGTIGAIREELSAGGPLLYRYRPDGRASGVPEGAFLPCSFWLVTALARSDRIEEAAELFDDCCHKANDVGLFAEEIDPSTGRFLGNFPQSLSHAAAAQAALALPDATTAGGKSPTSRRTRRARPG